PVIPPASTSASGPWANPDGSIQAVATMPTRVTRAAGTDRRGRRPTTGVNWCAAPSTAVVRKASMPTCTAATEPGWVGMSTMRSAENHAASPNATRPTPAAARNPSGTDAGGTAAVAPGTNGAAVGADAGAVAGICGAVGGWTVTGRLPKDFLVSARTISGAPATDQIDAPVCGHPAGGAGTRSRNRSRPIPGGVMHTIDVRPLPPPVRHQTI